MKIGVLGTRGIPARYSGFETNVEEVGARLAAKGHDVSVFCRSRFSESDAGSHRGIRRIILPSADNKYLDTLSHTTMSLMRLHAIRPDVVHLYGVGNAVFVPLIRLMGFPVVMSVDGLDWERKKWGKFPQLLLRWSAHLVANSANAYVVDSLVTLEHYKARFRRWPEYIPYGANVQLPSQSTGILDEIGLRSRDYILFVGRLEPEKRVDTLIKAFCSTDASWRLVIVGDNPYDREYVAWLKSLADPRVVFPGYVYGDGYLELCSQCAFYVQPSEVEGTSPALLGAMGMGSCVLVSNIPENLETIGDAGLFFQCGDEADLSRQIEFLAARPDLATDLRRRARERVLSVYDWDTIAEKWESLYSEVYSGVDQADSS